MNDKKFAAGRIKSFFDGEDSILVLRGTNSFKHVLAIQAAYQFHVGGHILFRSNSIDHLHQFLAEGLKRDPFKKTVFPLSLGSHVLHGDTTFERTWRKTPRHIDLAIVYPIDDLEADDGSACVEDILSRGAKKVVLATCSDITDATWLDHFEPVVVEYDHESEAIHHQAKACEADILARRVVGTTVKLPGYAADADATRLVRMHCDGCRKTSWALMASPYPGISVLRSAGRGAFEAQCLKCGNVQDDCHKWYGNK